MRAHFTGFIFPLTIVRRIDYVLANMDASITGRIK